MTPERLAQLRHHHERHAHFSPAMVGELLAYVSELEQANARLREALTQMQDALTYDLTSPSKDFLAALSRAALTPTP